MHHPHHHDHDHDDLGRCVPRFESQSASPLSEYSKHGIRFKYPSDWTLTEQTNDQEITISTQSDGTSFWTLMLFHSRPDLDEVLDTVVAAFEQDYEDVDVMSVVDSLCGLPSLGRELDFVCYDLVNSASVRAFQTADLTVMVLYQGTDHELETTRDQLVAMTSSLACDDADE